MMKTAAEKSAAHNPAPAPQQQGGGAVLVDRRESSAAIQAFLPEIETSQPVVAQRQAIRGAFGPVVQRAVDYGAVDQWLDTEKLPDKYDVEGQDLENMGSAYGRDVFDTLLFLELLQNRYGNSIQELKGQKYNFASAVTNLINKEQTITRAVMLQAFAAVEGSYELTPVRSESFSPSTHGIAASREGAYQYDQGHAAFAKWITGKLDAPLGLGAYINCWEAILAVVIETHPELQKDLGEVVEAYGMVAKLGGGDAEPGIIQAVDKLFRSRQRAVIKYGDKDPPPAVQRGDVLSYNRHNETLYHVVIALADANDYREAEVMSMWKQRAETFAKRRFGFLMQLAKPGDEIVISDFSK